MHFPLRTADATATFLRNRFDGQFRLMFSTMRIRFNVEVMARCSWASTEPAITYHDKEWGVPVHDDRVLFEFLILEGAQAGLSWNTILKKRENYRKALGGFRPERSPAMASAM